MDEVEGIGSVTEAEARKLCEQAKAPLPAGMHAGNFEHKYGARKKELDGHKFDSTGEATAYQILRSWELAGAISGLKLQPRFVIQKCFHFEVSSKRPNPHKARDVVYVPDFEFQRAGARVVVDYKGFQTAAYRIKVRIFREEYPDIVFEEWTRETLRANS